MSFDSAAAPLARRVIARTHRCTEPRILSSGTASVKNLRQLMKHHRLPIRCQLAHFGAELAKLVGR